MFPLKKKKERKFLASPFGYPFEEGFPRKGNFSAQKKSVTPPHAFEILPRFPSTSVIGLC